MYLSELCWDLGLITVTNINGLPSDRIDRQNGITTVQASHSLPLRYIKRLEHGYLMLFGTMCTYQAPMRNISTIDRSAIIHGPTKPVFGQLVRKIAFQGDDIACFITSLGHRPKK